MCRPISEVKAAYRRHRREIVDRLKEFERVGRRASGKRLFAELVFCLLTPQSKAKSCWRAVENLRKKGLLFRGSKAMVAGELRGVRFPNNKAGYILRARDLFASRGALSVRRRIASFSSPEAARDWLVENVVGMGYKEAGHFLRNIGLGDNLAILDRHVLRNLAACGATGAVPTALSRKKYLEIENHLKRFAKTLRIPPAHLDLALWCKETGEIFK
ncbi:MAG: N-glycosylase/DNA lyase [Planctomycetota bacterium]|nr:N-glycosylase/DNA lyase [Planctomycetota bacterium]